jgi:toxin ParE1/3/4
MKIVWSPEATEDLGSLRAYIAEDNSAAARRVVLHVIQSVEQLLPDNPQIGRAGRVPGTRDLVIARTPYIVPYRFRHSTIQILRVYQRARRWPDRLLTGGHGLQWDWRLRRAPERTVPRSSALLGSHSLRCIPGPPPIYFFRASRFVFLRRTPGPPPFSSMNSTPADSNARRTARSFAAVIEV